MRYAVVALTLLGSLAGAVPAELGFTPAQYGLLTNGTIFARQTSNRLCPPGYGLCPNTPICAPFGAVCCGLSGTYCDGYEKGELCYDEDLCCRVGSRPCEDGYGAPVIVGSNNPSVVRPSSTGGLVPNPPLRPTDPEMTGLTVTPTVTRSFKTYEFNSVNFPGPSIVPGGGNANHLTNLNGNRGSTTDPAGNAANTQQASGNPVANNAQSTGVVNGSDNRNGSGNANTVGSGSATPSSNNGASSNLPAAGPIGLALAALLLV